jgi:4-diphosphocytidyl-2-C-methyl-D-erythritol kinase
MAYPGFTVSTAMVYGNLKLKLTKRENNISILKNFLLHSEYAQMGASWFNDLEPIVFKQYPWLSEIKKEMLTLGAKGALLSGSGSTVFGIFDNPEIAKNAYTQLDRDGLTLFLAESVASLSELYPEEILR